MLNKSKNFDFQSKLLIIGDSSVGKSNIMTQFADNLFHHDYLTTIGVDFKTKIIEINGKSMKLQIWDSSGQEKFQVITKSYYKGAQGIIITYAIDNRQSFNNMSKWIHQIEEHALENVQKIIVGNKCDLQSTRQISYEEGEKFAQQYKSPFFETSAKDNINIQEVFQTIGQDILKYIEAEQQEYEDENQNQPQRLSVNPVVQNQKKKKCC